MKYTGIAFSFKISRLIVSILFGFLLFANSIYGQTNVVVLRADSMRNNDAEISISGHKWLYHAGDDPAWAMPQLNDHNWKPAGTDFGTKNEPPGWSGIGWFRCRIKASTSLAGKTLAFRITHYGASEIYIDGVYKGSFGKVGHSAGSMKAAIPDELILFNINDDQTHLIAVRYANYSRLYPTFIGFDAGVGEARRLHELTQNNQRYINYILLCIGAQLSLVILHLFLFVFYPKQRLNLYYCIFCVIVLLLNWSSYAVNSTTSPAFLYFAQTIFKDCNVLITCAAWFLFYKVGYSVLPRWKVIAVSVLSAFYLVKYSLDPFDGTHDGFNIFLLIVSLDGLWSLFLAIKRGQPGIWIIGVGTIIIVCFFFFVGADILHIWTNHAAINFTMSIGFFTFPLSFSIYIALDFARTNKDLSSKLIQVEALSSRSLAQEAEKLELITGQAAKLEQTVFERTAEVQKQADQLIEMDAVKSRFMINLTHEFRTPLTLILGPVRQILSYNQDNRTVEHLNVIHRNADRLLQLVNQLLDLSKLEAGKMELHNAPVELISLVKQNLFSFESLAAQKHISLGFAADWVALWVSTDQDKLERILYNLLSNAVKFTGDNGTIELKLTGRITDAGNWFELEITDTGTGIPERKMPYIFDRFYQADLSDTRAQEGTGIGLAITKELTALMGGELTVRSKVGEGTVVSLLLPIILADPAESAGSLPSEPNAIPITALDKEHPTAINKDVPLILVIEDNKEIREFIASILTPEYRVIISANGEEGVAAGVENVPDLVITDLMMPLMDGFEVCTALKGNEKTSHVPVVILTAKADKESRISGITSLADAYIGKPFDQRELLAIITNLITTRRQLRERYGKNNVWLTDAEDIPSMEKVFLDKVKKAIEEHLENEQYSIEQLAEDIHLSRTQLHRKLKSLIGHSPGDLIRIMRLERACELLKNNIGTVAEVCYMVGFTDPKYFSTSFSKHFSFSPSQAVKN